MIIFQKHLRWFLGQPWVRKGPEVSRGQDLVHSRQLPPGRVPAPGPTGWESRGQGVFLALTLA